jgi:small subunit ribosomal protein S4
MQGKKMRRGSSEYGTQLAIKQKVKRIYGILERQFKKHFEEVKGKKGITGDLFLARLEMRLDNVVYRMGISPSRSGARQLVNHGLITVDGKKVTIPSYEVKIGQRVGIKTEKKGKNYFKNLGQTLKNKKDFPVWMSFDIQKAEAKIIGIPEKKNIGINVDAQIIVEYYSR